MCMGSQRCDLTAKPMQIYAPTRYCGYLISKVCMAQGELEGSVHTLTDTGAFKRSVQLMHVHWSFDVDVMVVKYNLLDQVRPGHF